MTNYNATINYNSFINYNGIIVNAIIGGGAADDSWDRYLNWLAKKKKAEFKKKAASASIKEVSAGKIAEIANQEILKQEIALKIPYYENIDKSEQEARNAAYTAIASIYDEVWRQMAIQKQQVVNLHITLKKHQQEEEEAIFLIMM